MRMSVASLLLSPALLVPSVNAQDEQAPSPISITTAQVQSEELILTVPTAGTVHSRNAAQITAGLDARLEWVAEPGSQIALGAPVASFDCSIMRLRREEQSLITDRERVRHDSLGRESQRLEAATLATSVIQIERVRADRELALREIQISEARVRQIDTDLERCTISAPIAGTVTARMHRGGEDVSRGNVLATMTDTQNLEVRAAVPVRHLPQIYAGVPVEIRSSATRLLGEVRTAVPAADATSQTFEVRVDLAADAWQHVAAGQLVSLNLPLAPTAGLTVPRDAIVLRADGTYVMRIDTDQRAHAVAVDVTNASGTRVAISGALAAGDRVAVRGAEGLGEGETVAILSDS